jgi:hypothetical protein
MKSGTGLQLAPGSEVTMSAIRANVAPIVKIESLSVAPAAPAVTIDRMTPLGKAANYR